MSKLVIAEKPSMGKTIACVLGADKRQDGFCEGNGYVVTWCFGFLSEFSEPEAYDEKYGKWRFDDLPIRPDVWQYTVMRDKKQQLDRIAALANRSDVTELVNACDARGRYGRLIMNTEDVLKTCACSPAVIVIATHMDTVSHAHLSRAQLHANLEERPGAEQVLIPEDGEWIEIA